MEKLNITHMIDVETLNPEKLASEIKAISSPDKWEKMSFSASQINKPRGHKEAAKIIAEFLNNHTTSENL